MKRYIAQFKPFTGGLYVVMHCPSKSERYQIGEPKPYHEALEEADERDKGTYGQPKPQETNVDWAPLAGGLGGLNLPTRP